MRRVSALFAIPTHPSMAVRAHRRIASLVTATSAHILTAGVLVVACGGGSVDGPSEPGPMGTSNATNQSPPIVPPPDAPPDPVDVDVGFAGVDCEEPPAVPAEGRLLTRSQYDNSVRDLFRGALDAQYSAPFPSENQVLGFSTNSEFHRASPLLTERHMTAAEAISDDAMPLLPQVLPCSQSLPDRACAESFIDDFGSRAFRRPLSEPERALFLELFDSASSRDGFVGSIRLLIQAFLQSPQFLYRFELVGDAVSSIPGVHQLSDYELASRLSYLLWNTMPDDALFSAAAAGELSEAEGLIAQATRMLADLKARDAVAEFYRQWLKLDRLGGIGRDSDGSPVQLGEAWRYSLASFVTHTFWNEGGNVDALLGSPTVFLNRDLANLYGVAVPAGLAEGQFFLADMSSQHRTGLLTQPGLMALYAHPEQSAPIQRGVFVRDAILCQPAPPPPPTVNNNPPDPDPSLTTRERFVVHTEDPGCAACHQLIDPIGLSFESFDQLGRYREVENGLPVDVSGGIVGVREDSLVGDVNGAWELSERLAQSAQVRQCLVTQWYRYGLGRVEQDEDVCSMKTAYDRFIESDGNMEQLLLGIVASDAFRYRGFAVEPEGSN